MKAYDLSLREPREFYARYLHDFDDLDEGPRLVELPLNWAVPNWTYRNFAYFERLARANGLICRFEYRGLDLCWYSRQLIGGEPERDQTVELAMEQEWDFKGVYEDFSKLIGANAYLKVLVCGGREAYRQRHVPDLPDMLAHLVATSGIEAPECSYLIIVLLHDETTWIEMQGFTIECYGGPLKPLVTKRFPLKPISEYS